jgi:polyisoprenyl-phosphate glycosyltransferase
MVSVIVPVYYNAGSLPILFRELTDVEHQLQRRDVAMELVFVDDGSRDDSFAELMKIKGARPDTRVIRLSRNFGAVHASKTGMFHVTGDGFLVLAADLQDPPALIPQMVDHWLAGAKFVVCARRRRSDPASTTWLAATYYALLRLLVARDYPTGGYDMALMDKIFLPYMRESSKNANTALFAYWLGFKPTTIPYDRRRREHGRSRWTLSKRLKFMIDSLLGFSVTPIRFISLVGVVVSALSMVYGTVILVNALRGKSEVHGFPTIVVLVSFLFGLNILMMGVIGEYIWRIFDEVNKRPETVIDEIH